MADIIVEVITTETEVVDITGTIMKIVTTIAVKRLMA